MAEYDARPAGPDPLYDPHYLIFVWALWVFVSWGLGNSAGLAALVAGTGVLAVFALKHDRAPEARSFAAEFSTVLLFCAASIGLSVFVATALSEAPQLLLGLALLAASGSILLRFVRVDPQT